MSDQAPQENRPAAARTGVTGGRWQDTDGVIAPGFDAVGREFQRNFDERGELGASFAAYLDGELVVDLWGGVADRSSGRLYADDTVQVIFSGSKGLVATCLLMLIERGLLDLEEPVATYWPEFAAAGKAQIRVSDLVSHRAGLPAFSQPIEMADLTSPDKLVKVLANQAPLIEPGSELCYHPLTFGWLCGELVRRVDGRRIGQLFAEDVARPLRLDIWFGAPDDVKPRIAVLELDSRWGEQSEAPIQQPLASLVDGNPPVWEPTSFPWNSSAFHGAEIPGAGAIGSCSSVAFLYACLARGGEIDNVRLLSESTIALGRGELSRGVELLSGVERVFGVGFLLQDAASPLGPPRDAFGHSGAGGSMHGAWPSERVGFSYAMNLMRSDAEDLRAGALLRALHECVRGSEA